MPAELPSFSNVTANRSIPDKVLKRRNPPAVSRSVQAAVVAADFAVDAARLAPLVVHHRQLGGGGVRRGALGRGASRLSDDGGVGIPQQRLGKVWLLQHLTALVYNSEGDTQCAQLTAMAAM